MLSLQSTNETDRLWTPQLVNQAHPLNHGRTIWWLATPELQGGVKFYDIVGLRHLSLTSMGNANNGWRSDHPRQGAISQSLLFDGTAGYCDYNGRTTSATKGSFACWLWWPNTNSLNEVFFCIGGTAGTYWQLYMYDAFGSGSNRIVINQSGTNTWQTGTGLIPAGGMWHHIAVTATGAASGWSIYIDGQATTLSAIASTNTGVWPGSLSITTPHTVLGAAYSFSAPVFTHGWASSYIDDVQIWDGRVLSAADVANLYYLSLQGYPGVLNRYTFLPEASTAKLINAAGGSFALTGGAATVRAARRVNLTGGVFTESVNNGTLRAARLGGLAGGSFALTGGAATVKAIRLANVAGGAYAETGGNATLTYTTAAAHYTANAAGGAFVLTGGAATVLAARLANLAGGTYTETGGAATVRAARLASLAGGSFALTGGAATVRAARRANLTGGTYSETGGAATTRATRLANVDGGAYAETGGAATVRAARRANLTGGAYTETGGAATVRAARLANVAGGAYAETGGAATVRATRLANTAGGVFGLSGGAATLTYFGRKLLNALGGAFVLAGGSANLAVSRLMNAGAGVYVTTGGAATVRAVRLANAAGGTVTETGGPAGLRAARLMSAGGTSVVISGGSSSLLAARFANIAGGAFALTGGAVTFTRKSPLGLSSHLSYAIRPESVAPCLLGSICTIACDVTVNGRVMVPQPESVLISVRDSTGAIVDEGFADIDAAGANLTQRMTYEWEPQATGLYTAIITMLSQNGEQIRKCRVMIIVL